MMTTTLRGAARSPAVRLPKKSRRRCRTTRRKRWIASPSPDAMARIAEALTTGGLIVVSDLGIGQSGETGEGTDFIIPLRMASHNGLLSGGGVRVALCFCR